jgi:hypothetical protein
MVNFRAHRGRAAWIMLGVLLLVVPVSCLVQYHRDEISVGLELAKVRTINNVWPIGYDKGPHYHIRCVQFGIVGKPGSTIRVGLYGANEGLSGSPEHVYLEQIGPWGLGAIERRPGETRMTLEGPMEWTEGRWVDVGPNGEFAEMLPVRIQNINDLVAHYDELVRYFASWPDKEHMGELVLPSGRILEYCRERGNPYSTTQGP